MNRIPGLCGGGNVVFARTQEREVGKTAIITSRIGKAGDTAHPRSMILEIENDLRASHRVAELIKHMPRNERHRRKSKNEVFGREFRPSHDRSRVLFMLLVRRRNEPTFRSLQGIFCGL